MEFDEQEDELGVESRIPPENFDAIGNSGRVRKSSTGGGGGGYRYRECLRNHALGIGGHALDGCGEFMAAGDDGTLEGLKCAACSCHRNFHRKEFYGQQRRQQQPQHPATLQLHHPYVTPPPYFHHHHRPSGYLHVTPAAPYPHHQRPLALPSSTSRDDLENLEVISNPSSSGGGGGGGNGTGTGGSGGRGSKKRFRTKFTPEQKDRMLAFSEALGWRIQKHDDAAVLQFCEEIGIKRHVLKIWMHNNKHTIGKKP